jgi:hypothetical protein
MHGFDALKVGLPAFKSFVVGMTDIMTYLVAFAADTTYLSHGYSFQIPKKIRKNYRIQGFQGSRESP